MNTACGSSPQGVLGATRSGRVVKVDGREEGVVADAFMTGSVDGVRATIHWNAGPRRYGQQPLLDSPVPRH
jgi:hypothetical protein